MDNATDISKMIARVTSADVQKPKPQKVDVANDLFFPRSSNAFTEVPVFRHQSTSDPQN